MSRRKMNRKHTPFRFSFKPFIRFSHLCDITFWQTLRPTSRSPASVQFTKKMEKVARAEIGGKQDGLSGE